MTDKIVGTSSTMASTHRKCTVFHTKRVKKCVFDILFDISGINCPTVMLHVSL